MKLITLKILLEQYQYSSTQFDLPPTEAEKVKSFGRSIPDDIIYLKPYDNSFGRETNPHVTIKYGLHNNNVEPVEEKVKGFGKVKIELGKISLFTPQEYDVVKIEVLGDDIFRLNKKIAELPNAETHPEYNPHITIAYVRKGAGEKYDGDSEFEGIKLEFDSLTFSNKDSNKELIYIGEKNEISGRT